MKVIGNLYQAMDEFERKTRVQFKMRTDNDRDYINIKPTTDIGCSSIQIGKLGGEQSVYLSNK